jgi:hypothetical protein
MVVTGHDIKALGRENQNLLSVVSHVWLAVWGLALSVTFAVVLNFFAGRDVGFFLWGGGGMLLSCVWPAPSLHCRNCFSQCLNGHNA